MMFDIKLIASLLVVAALAGCASGVTRLDGPAAGAAQGAPAPLADGTVKAVTISLSAEAKKLVEDNVKFNAETLRSTVERALGGRSLVKADAAQTLEIEITSFRTRSNFSAIMFGFMAGADNVEGIVTVKGADGAVLKKSKINASYALGGIGGGQDDARMSWLYEEFAKLTLAELSGPPTK